MSKKLEKFRQILKKREIPAALITDELNIGYLCDFRFSDGFLLIDETRAMLVTDFRYYEEAVSRCKGFEVVMPKDRMALIKEFLKNGVHKEIGFESDSMTVASYHRYCDALDTSFVPLGDVLTEMRSVKSLAELESIRRAQAITDEAFSHVLKMMTPTMTERDVALELSHFMKKQGGEGDSFEIICVSGASSALPHGKCRNVQLSKGFLTMDFGCVYDGYCSDMTRTVCIGKADVEMKRLYHTVLDAQMEALAAVKAGESCAFIDRVARQCIEDSGYPSEAFGHSLGHGVGLYIHEKPALSPNAAERRLVAGNVITVEPGIYLMGKYGCRIEDMGAVTEQGFDNFTKSTKDLIELFA